MCVLTFIPHSDGRVTITHNRDEHILRPQAVPPQVYQIGNQRVTFPKDPQGGGTWFAVHDDWVVCLLNGGFEKHESRPPYKESRGTVITKFFQYADIQQFSNNFVATGYEPFTLVVFNLKEKKIQQFAWDEHVLHIQHLDSTKPQIWSSSTLYSSSVKAMRKQIFQQFASIKPSYQQILEFHNMNVNNDLHKSFFVNIEDKIKTVATIQASGRQGKMKLNYKTFYENYNAKFEKAFAFVF
jgi:uncharacterized protein with NRDE domain